MYFFYIHPSSRVQIIFPIIVCPLLILSWNISFTRRWSVTERESLDFRITCWGFWFYHLMAPLGKSLNWVCFLIRRTRVIRSTLQDFQIFPKILRLVPAKGTIPPTDFPFPPTLIWGHSLQIWGKTWVVSCTVHIHYLLMLQYYP